MLPPSANLIYFLEVATELSFSRAAKKLNISQPSLSIAIKRLEESLSTILFIRHKRGVNLTKAGSELFKDLKKLLVQWDEILKNVKVANQAVKGRVLIGCHSTLGYFMTTFVKELLKLHPGLEIHFQHELTPKIMDDVLLGYTDIGITTDPYLNKDLIIQKIGVAEFAFWKSTVDGIQYDLYDEETVIICDPQLPPTQFLLKALQKYRKNKPLRLSAVNNIEAIANMTAEGCGLGILPTRWTECYFKGNVVKIKEAPIYGKPLCLVYRPENKNAAAIKIVLDAIKSLIHSTVAHEPCDATP